jgi:hypothetical protein
MRRSIVFFLFAAAATSAEAQSIAFQWEEFNWKAPEPTLYLAYGRFNPATGITERIPFTANNSVCVLTEVWGSFAGTDFVYLSTDPDRQDLHQQRTDHAWYLRGSFGAGRQGGATARCVPLARFSAYRPGGLMWDRFGVDSRGVGNWAWMWWDDAIAIFAGLRGNFDDANDYAGVRPRRDDNAANPTRTAFAVVAASRTFGLPLMAWGRSVFLGSRIGYAGRYRADAVSVPSVSMGYTDEQLCYLASVSGRFRGAGERVGVTSVLEPSTGRQRWVLQAQSAQVPRLLPNNSNGAEAECIWF